MVEEVDEAAAEAPFNHLLRDGVPSFLDTQTHTGFGQFHVGQPEEDEGDAIAPLLRHADGVQVGDGGKGGFDGEVFFGSHQVLDAAGHDLPRLKGGLFGLERGDAARNLVCIHELLALQDSRQQMEGCRRLAGSVASR